MLESSHAREVADRSGRNPIRCGPHTSGLILFTLPLRRIDSRTGCRHRNKGAHNLYRKRVRGMTWQECCQLALQL